MLEQGSDGVLRVKRRRASWSLVAWNMQLLSLEVGGSWN